MTHTRSTASNLEQVANLLCAQANSASYPQRHGSSAIVGYGVKAMVCLLAAPWVQLSVARAMDSHIWRCGTIGSCQSASTFEIVKRCLLVASLTRKRRYNKCPDLHLYLYLAIISQFYDFLSASAAITTTTTTTTADRRSPRGWTR